MSLTFTEEQVLLQQTVKEFVETEVAPQVTEILANNTFPRALYQRSGELGFWYLGVPEENGGFAQGLTEECLVLEEVAKVLPTLALCIGNGMSNIPLLAKSEALQQYMETCMSGGAVLACSAADVKGRSNVGDWDVFAVQDGNEWVLNGTRHYKVGNNAELKIAIGLTEAKQMKAFLIKKGTEGMKTTEGYHNTGVYLKYGMPGSDGGTTVFENCRIPLDMTCDIELGNTEDFSKNCQYVSAQALGCAEGMLAQTIDYCKMRTHDFKPLSNLAVVAQKLTYMQSLMEAAHSMVYDAAAMYDEAVQTRDKSLMHAWAVKAEAAKLFVSEAATTITKICTQLHGGMAYHTPALHHYVGDAMAYCIMGLSNDVLYDRMAVLMGLKETED